MHKKAAVPRLLLWLLAAGVSANAAEKEAAYSPAMPQHSVRSPRRMKAPAKRLPALSSKYAPAAKCRGRVFAHTAEGQASEFRGLQNALLLRSAAPPTRGPAPPAYFRGNAFIFHEGWQGLSTRSSLFTEFSVKDGIDRQSAPRGVPSRGALCNSDAILF